MKVEKYKYIILLISSFILTLLIFHGKLFQIEKLLFNSYGDGLKNYFTFIYHALYGKGVYFKGMNYPYGEHVTYTDGQPFFLFLTNLIPIVNDINDGIFIINLLMLLSIFATPIIVFKILKFYNLPTWFAIPTALIISFNSPQLNRINAHYALSYSFIIPFIYYQYLKFFENKNYKPLVLIGIISTLVGFIHPYYSLLLFVFGGSILLVKSIRIVCIKEKNEFTEMLSIAIVTIVPILINYLFISYTDTVSDRIEVPFGSSYYVTNLSHLFVPFTGYMNRFWQHFIYMEKHSEGDVYLGLTFGIVLIIITVSIILRLIKKKNINFLFKSNNYIVLSCIPILFLSIGYHETILAKFNISGINKSLSQFRSLARMSWLFYFISTPFLAYKLYYLIISFPSKKFSYLLFSLVLISYANDLFSEIQHYYNRLSYGSSTYQPVKLDDVDFNKYQAILPFPYRHLGSEKVGLTSKVPINNHIKLSLESGLPLMSSTLSRTSISQTSKQIMHIVNINKRGSVIDDIKDKRPLLLMVLDKHTASESEQIILENSKYLSNKNGWSYYEYFPKYEKLELDSSSLEIVHEYKQRIESKNYLVSEEIEILSLENTNRDSLIVEIHHELTNKIHGLPDIQINGKVNKNLSAFPFEIISGNIVSRITIYDNSKSIKMKIIGKGIGINKILVYKIL